MGDLIGNSPAMQDVYDLIERSALCDDCVIISGESGTGKERVAEAIHRGSKRQGGLFVPVNCSAIPETLIESEFFGYKKNAFTGAARDKKGFLDLADGGTLFLDEIGDIGLPLQVKLLRAIDGGGYTPLGGTELKKPDLRIIAASNKNLKKMMNEGRMRSDFYYRIHVIPITLPPLRNREDDVLLIADHFLKTFNEGKGISVLTPQEVDRIKHHPWPGNIRELQNALRRYQSLKSLDFLTIEPQSAEKVTQPPGEREEARPTLQDALLRYEKKILLEALENNRWHKAMTAQELGISRKTLFRKMKACGIA
ncbi:sigma-54 dependent transcriptional regulator [Desulfoluna sp.]|uniref:sigma-54 interaction domain-containing protein n=1 Tax=Desulfoluna sp. TaxID=2045199 RepID=UPI0026213FA5|nr:sigma-54 dependent transcriptional regulator [Desulfoluna sp.]